MYFGGFFIILQVDCLKLENNVNYRPGERVIGEKGEIILALSSAEVTRAGQILSSARSFKKLTDRGSENQR